jgi:serine/threonine protein kinase
MSSKNGSNSTVLSSQAKIDSSNRLDGRSPSSTSLAQASTQHLQLTRSLSESSSVTDKQISQREPASPTGSQSSARRKTFVLAVKEKSDPPSDQASSRPHRELRIVESTAPAASGPERRNSKIVVKSKSTDEQDGTGSQPHAKSKVARARFQEGAHKDASQMSLVEFRRRKCAFRWPKTVDGTSPSNCLTLKAAEGNPLRWMGNMGSSAKAMVCAHATTKECGFEDTIAIKELRTRSESAKQKVLEEIKNLRGLRHAHTIELLGTLITPDTRGILMFPVASYNLFDFMALASDHNKKSLVDASAVKHEHEHATFLRRYFACLCQVLIYLHEVLQIKHKDIKPENILVDRYDSIILTDFGISTRHADSKTPVTVGPTDYTVKYGAPEAVSYKARGFEMDIFSLGCVFLEMATVILGETLENLYSKVGMVRQSGNTVKYHQSFDKVREWVTHLQNWRMASPDRTLVSSSQRLAYIRGAPPQHVDSQTMDIEILNDILLMMSEEATNRPTLHQLWNKFDKTTEPCDNCHPLVRRGLSRSLHYILPIVLDHSKVGTDSSKLSSTRIRRSGSDGWRRKLSESDYSPASIQYSRYATPQLCRSGFCT